MIQMAHAVDGRIFIATNNDHPSDIARVEFYRDLNLLMLAFECEEDELMPREVDPSMIEPLSSKHEITIAEIQEDGSPPLGYVVPLVHIGVGVTE